MEQETDRLIEERIRQIKSYLCGELTPLELQAFQEWVDASESNRKLFDRIRNSELLLEKIHFVERNDKEMGWKNIQRHISSKSTWVVRLLRYAATILLPLAIGLILFYVGGGFGSRSSKEVMPQEVLLKKGGSKAYLELVSGTCLELDSLTQISQEVKGGSISTQTKGTIVVDAESAVAVDSVKEEVVKYNRLLIPKGGEYKIILEDGTQVWMNSLSTLEFPIRFVGKERRVRLTGEAYFDVAQNADQPFIVECGDKELKVLGTTFNVSDYNAQFVATLETGKIAVQIGNELYDLKPSMQLRAENGQVSLQHVNTKEFTAWKDGLFIFKKQRLEDVLETLARWYNMEIRYQKEELKNLHFTGTIERHRDISEVLKFLEKTEIVNFKISERTLFVSY